MSDSDQSDGTWEDFFGASSDLMPSIMGAFDAIIENTLNQKQDSRPNTPKKTLQSSNFANLSPGVQQILSHVSDQEITKTFSSEESLIPRKMYNKRASMHRSQRSFHKSNESLEIISTNVQKMLSNLPDNELVISATNLHVTVASRSTVAINHHVGGVCNGTASNNVSYLYSKRDSGVPKASSPTVTTAGRNNDDNNADDNKTCGKTFLYRSNSARSRSGESCTAMASSTMGGSALLLTVNGGDSEKCEDDPAPKPLGSYLHTSPHGIASRTPVGRKNLGKYLQVPSEGSGNGGLVGSSVSGTTTSSTASSSEVSRPVSLTSLGSCSSSGSSGPHHTGPGSTYLASAESLDSDPEPTGSQGSADSGIAEQPTMSPEMRVLQEVLDTETVYVADLSEVIQGYLKPWKEEEGCALTDYLQDLFSNIVEIYEFNRSFLDQLREADFDPSKLANVFLQNDNGFSVYNEYCRNYPRTMDVIGELTRDVKMAPLFREKQIGLGHALPLASYLLKPVQRILKYHLLLQRLSKVCEQCHQPAVDLALTTMTGVASSINTMKKKHEHAVRVQEIQSQLYGWSGPDLTALGELIAEGIFRVNGARGRRHVFLFDKVLLIAKSKQDGAVAYKSHIMTSNLMLVEHVRGEPLSFQVLNFDNPRLACTLKARSFQHKREWTLQIKRVMLENYAAVIPSHARQLVLQLGQDAHEFDDPVDRWSPLKQHSTPHYLERRCRVRKSRDSSNSRRASSQDRSFPSLGGWRRKSEPDMIPQYNTKTLPKKISKLKKAKESGSKFYTDLSDSETCNLNGESFESLQENNDDCKQSCDTIDDVGKSDKVGVPENIEKIVSDLIMENADFHKLMNRQRRKLRDSEPDPAWLQEERPELQAKADSLPRSFQLNDQISSRAEGRESTLEESVNENLDSAHEGKQDIGLSSLITDDNDYPEHKIYRNTGIRLSILQRFRAMLSEQQRNGSKYPLHKQGSKSMGEKLAHPDYVDPQKLFVTSHSSSNLVLTADQTEAEDRFDNFLDDTQHLDMTISENEVLTEFEKRLYDKTGASVEGDQEIDTGQGMNGLSSHSVNEESTTETETVIESSHNSDSYYESLLDEKLVEEYVRDKNGQKVLKQDSFRSNKSDEITTVEKISNSSKPQSPSSGTKKSNTGCLSPIKIKLSPLVVRKHIVKRPTKAPPPVPMKPARLLQGNYQHPAIIVDRTECDSNRRDNCSTINGSINCLNYLNGINSSNQTISHMPIGSGNTGRSWVKAMVGRFE